MKIIDQRQPLIQKGSIIKTKSTTYLVLGTTESQDYPYSLLNIRSMNVEAHYPSLDDIFDQLENIIIEIIKPEQITLQIHD